MTLKITLCALGLCLGFLVFLLLFLRMPFFSMSERLQMFPEGPFPVEKPVQIRWNKQAVPYVEAENLGDLAFATGLVHTHLRWAQLEILRRLSQGRLSEMAGPWTVEVDRLLRTFHFGKAAPEMIRTMPAETKLWAERFLAGINHYIEHARGPRPREFRWLGIAATPWTLEELVGVWRLASADVNWLVLLSAVRHAKTPGWERAWKTLLEVGAASHPSFLSDKPSVGDVLVGSTRSGSNALAVGRTKSKSGAALLAGDPHLGIQLPNFWILIGLKAPGFHAVGLMIPGVPMVAVGRNPEIAWGGTNMWGLSSLLQKESDGALASAKSREERIRVRGWKDRTVTIRETAEGPVISDSKLLQLSESVVLKWVGHHVSDEVTAFLRANRAHDFESFRQAFDTYAVSGMNMIYADRKGHIGQVLAIRQPVLTTPSLPYLADVGKGWKGMRRPTELPSILDPKAGFIVSANNRPESTTPVGYFFSSNDRVDRLHELLKQSDRVDLDELRKLQHDVLSRGGARLVRLLQGLSLGDPFREDPFWKTLLAWDGEYRADAKGPAAFEGFFARFAPKYLGAYFGDAKLGALFLSNPSWKGVIEKTWNEVPVADRVRWAKETLTEGKDDSARYRTWGELHRLPVRHILGGVPWIGRWFAFEEFGVNGGADTLMKTSAPLNVGVHDVSYGSQARQLIDLADADSNYFVLLGGQDGWLRSENTLDQVALWKRGETIQMPLRADTVRTQFPIVTALAPNS